MYKYLLLIWLSAAFSFVAAAQSPDTSSAQLKSKTDSIQFKKNDTTVSATPVVKKKKEKVYHPDSLHSPHTAIMHSLLIPGWGQVYNHRWWKVPVIYGALGALGYYIVWSNDQYVKILNVSLLREHGQVPVKGSKYYDLYQAYYNANITQLTSYTDYYRRIRDLDILGVFVAWGVNVVDAYIDAKFMNAYTVDNNLSMKVSPVLMNQQTFAQNFSNSYIPGLKITFTF
ncbi:MAG: DUF5683 domain-containing protein [Sphingobacteriales bacterium]